MLELPDVEGFRATLAEHGQGHRIRRVDVIDKGVLRGIGARALAGSFGAFFDVHMTISAPFQVKMIGTLRGVPSVAT